MIYVKILFMERRPALILNFGSQYVQLIARRVREIGIYSEILPYDTSYEDILKKTLTV